MSLATRTAINFALSLVVVGCAGNPVGADRLPSAAVHQISSASGAAAALLDDRQHLFGLANGTFTIETSSGDTIVGTYTGEASVAIPGRDLGTLQLIVTGGSGMFTGATGNLTGRANGAFAGEGTFLLVVTGSLSTASEPVPSSFHVTLHGNAVASCAPDHRIEMHLTGGGVAGRWGAVRVALSHRVDNTTCAS